MLVNSQGPYPLDDLCRIGVRIRARISHWQPVVAPILALIPVGMTLQLGNWPSMLSIPNVICDIMCKSLRTGSVPTSWLKGVINVIPKGPSLKLQFLPRYLKNWFISAYLII